MRDVKKIERKLCLTNSAAAKICSIANKKGEEKNKIFAAKQMLVYYLGDILVILRKDSYTPDDILLLILKTSMCLNAKRHTIFSLPLSFTKYTLTETKLIIQRGCFNLREDEIQLYRVRDIAFKQNFYERLCRVGSIHLCSTDAMTPEIDIRRIKNPRDVKEVLSKTIEACRKANGIRTSEIIGDHGHFPEPAPHGMPPEPCHEHPHN